MGKNTTFNLIDEALFAHINNDAYLRGSYALQGYPLSKTIAYLSAYINDIENVSGEIKDLQLALEELLKIQTELSATQDEEGLTALANKIVDKIAKLTEGDSILLPGGWLSRLSSGHAIIYQIDKDNAGNILFKVINSGRGINQYHAKDSSLQNELYDPILTYRIPKDKFNKKFFSNILAQLLKLQIPKLHRYANIKPEQLYLDILQQLSYMDGELISDFSCKSQYTKGQLSGTCAERVLHQMLKQRFKNIDDYKRFMYGFKLRSLEDYYAKLKKSADFNEIKYLEVVEQAIRHQLRILNSFKDGKKTEYLFSKEQRQADLAKFTNYLAEIHSIKALSAKNSAVNSANKAESLTNSEQHLNDKFYVSFPKTIPLRDFSDVALDKDEALTEQLSVRCAKDLLADLDKIITHAEKLTATQDHTLLTELENLINNLPIPDNIFSGCGLIDFYSDINDHAKMQEFYTKILRIQELYFACCKRLIGEHVTPKMYLFATTLQTIVGYINCANYKQMGGVCFYADFGGFFNPELLSNNKYSPYFATENPDLDARLQKIRSLHANILPQGPANCRKFYTEIVKSDPVCRNIIIDLMNKNGLDMKIFSGEDEENLAVTIFISSFLEKKYAREDLGIHANMSLLDKFTTQILLERCLFFSTRMQNSSGKMCHLFPADETKIFTLTHELKEEDSKIPNLLQTKFTSLGKDFQHALHEYAYNEKSATVNNEIQLRNINDKTPITKSTFKERELYHLRLHKDTQIDLTLDYFSRNLHHLEDKQYQTYLVANLFEPGLLLKKLASPPDFGAFLNHFDEFIKLGLQHATKSNLSLELIYFLRLKYLVNQYAFTFDVKNPVYAARMTDFAHEIDAYLRSPSDKDTQYKLHALRFLTLANFAAKTPDYKDLQALLVSYFYLQTQPANSDDDFDTEFQIERFKHKFSCYLRERKKDINENHIQEILSALNIPLTAPFSIRGEYPLFLVQGNEKEEQYSVNVDKGVVYNKDNLAYTLLPKEILNLPLFKILGIKPTYGYVSIDQFTYQIDEPSNSFFVHKDDRGYFIQRKFIDLNNEQQYFQLMPFNETQGKYLGVPCFTARGLRNLELLRQRDVFIYKHLNKNELVITDKANNIIVRGEGDENNNWQLFSYPENHVLVDSVMMEHPLFNCDFEDKKFINVYYNANKNQYELKLGRYNLSFSVDKTTNSLLLNHKGKEYTLKTTSKNLEGLPFLQFKQNNTAKEIAIIPIQRFINIEERHKDNEYYKFKLDVKHDIAGMMAVDDKEELWQYSNEERYYTFNIVNGVPKPETPAEALYLCYLYLGNHNPKMALEVLDYCKMHLGGLEGKYDELRYIDWIFNELPHRILKDDSAVPVNPIYTACKLKALALLTSYQQQRREFTLPPNLEPDSSNNRYMNQQNDDIKDFYKNICSTIYAEYSEYLNMAREKHVEFELSEDEKKSLLYYYHDNIPEAADSPKALGALGYAFVSIRLNELKKELASLQVKLNPSAYELNRIKEINALIKDYKGVASRRSELTYVQIDTDIPIYLTYRYDKSAELNNSCLEERMETNFDVDTLMSYLEPNPDIKLFSKAFPFYLKVAENPNDPNHEKLRHFCHATLVSNRHVELTSRKNDIPLLCNILYRVSNARKPLPQKLTYNDLLIYAERLPKPKILVPEFKDFTNKLLKTSDEIINELPLYEEVTKVTLTSLEVKSLQSFPLFLALEGQNYQTKAKEWNKFVTGLPIEAREQDSAQTFLSNAEFTQGLAKYKGLQALTELADEHFNPVNLTKLSLAVTQRIEFLTEVQDSLENIILSIANRGPEDQNLHKEWEIDIAASKRLKLDIKRLIALFFKNDLELYKKETGLKEEQIRILHAHIMQYANLATTLGQLNRVEKSIEEINSAKEADKPRLKVKLGDVLYSENLISHQEDNELLVYQLYANLLLKPQQKDVIKRLISKTANDGYVENIERLIMGAGKTKVLLPILAYKKTTGKNLVIVEVPKALLRTNFVDLKDTSLSLFGQDSFIFEFNRHSNASSEDLEKIHRDLTDIMVNKNYLVTTNDALQALELKYLELLSNIPNTEKKEWEKQILWLDRIIKLFKERGDLIIDEVHQGLLLKNKLNFTLGDSINIRSNIIRANLNLYKFFSQVSLANNLTFNELLTNNKLLSDPKFKEQAFTRLAHELVFKATSPLNQYIVNLTAENKQELANYLSGNATTIPDFFSKIGSDEREILALYKGQITKLLPHTLHRNYMEHYGPSRDINDCERRMLAIPYLANNSPNERSRFGNYIETLNYTTQGLLIGGIPIELLKEYLKSLQQQMRFELIDLNLTKPEDTPSARQFRVVIKNAKYQLSTLDLQDNKTIGEIHKIILNNEEIIYGVLEKNILPFLKNESNILHSDAYNHVDMVRSCQGFSGTPWNHSTFHQRLKYYQEGAQGLNGLVFQAFKHKTDKIIGFDFAHLDTAIEELFSRYNDEPLRAIIDINATFKGVDNATLARAIADYLLKHKTKLQNPKPIRHILYFNEDNKITALPLENYPNEKPIVMGSSDGKLINERLNSTEDERFTIYDQDHTTGVDITQGENAKALVFVDERTTLSNCFQGIMRMRSLISGNQRIDLVVPKFMESSNIEDLCTTMHNHEATNLKDDNYFAACAKLKNVIRNNALQRILALDGENASLKKHQTFLALKNVFIETQEDDFWAKYGQIDAMADTKSLLNLYAKSLIAAYLMQLKQLNITLTMEERDSLQENMTFIVTEAAKEGVCNAVNQARQDNMSEAVEIQKEVQVENEVQKEMQQEYYNESIFPAYHISWPKDLSDPFLFETLNPKRLDEIFTYGKDKLAIRYQPGFTANISATENFYRSCPANLNGNIRKPVHALLFRRIYGKLECIILSQRDCVDVYDRFKNQGHLLAGKECWLTTTNHTLLAGSRPKNFLEDSEYQTIIEEVKFFNGELSTLLEQKEPFSWLSKDSKKKMDFFTSYLYPNCETQPRHLAAMHKRLNSPNKLYKYIIENLSLDFAEYPIENNFPALDNNVKQEAKKLSAACNILAQKWDSMNLNSPAELTKFDLNFEASSYLNIVVDDLITIKKLVEVLFAIAKSKTKQEHYCQFVQNFKLNSKLAPTVNKSFFEFVQDVMQYLQDKGIHIPSMLYAILADDPNISQVHFAIISKLVLKDTTMLTSILNNPTSLITPKELNAFLNAEHSSESILALAKHKNLTQDMQLAVIKKAIRCNCTAEVSAHFLSNQEYAANFFQEIIKNDAIKLNLEDFAKVAHTLPNYDLIEKKLKLKDKPQNIPKLPEFLDLNKLKATSISALKTLIQAYPSQELLNLIVEGLSEGKFAENTEELLLYLLDEEKLYDPSWKTLKPMTPQPFYAEKLMAKKARLLLKIIVNNDDLSETTQLKLLQSDKDFYCDEVFTKLATKTKSAKVLNYIASKIVYKFPKELSDSIINNKHVTAETVRLVFAKGRTVGIFQKLLSLVNSIKELLTYGMNVIKSMFQQFIGTVNIDNPITSNRFILFKTQSKEEKDTKIDNALARLNMDIVNNKAIDPAFIDLSRTVCTRRNKLSACFFGTYSVHTKSAEYLVDKLATNNTILQRLHINSVNDKEIKDNLRAKMSAACQ